MNRIFFLGFVLLPLVGCKELHPQAIVSSTNADYVVSFLFEQGGCRIYRFEDGGYYRYFTNCKGSTNWVRNEQHGKTSTDIPEGVEGSQ